MEKFEIVDGGGILVVLGTILVVAVFISYAVALRRGDVLPFLPYISDAGSTPPESGIFSFCLFVSSVLGVLCFALRYAYINELNVTSRRSTRLLNKAALIVGIIGFIGMAIVASFALGSHRDDKDFAYATLLPHGIGAFTLFVGVAIYLFIHCFLTYRLQPSIRWMFAIRAVLALLLLGAFIAMIASAGKAVLQTAGNDNSTANTSGEYSASYNTSTVAEWLFFFGAVGSVITYIGEAREFSIQFIVKRRVPNEIPDSFVRRDSTDPCVTESIHRSI